MNHRIKIVGMCVCVCNNSSPQTSEHSFHRPSSQSTVYRASSIITHHYRAAWLSYCRCLLWSKSAVSLTTDQYCVCSCFPSSSIAHCLSHYSIFSTVLSICVCLFCVCLRITVHNFLFCVTLSIMPNPTLRCHSPSPSPKCDTPNVIGLASAFPNPLIVLCLLFYYFFSHLVLICSAFHCAHSVRFFFSSTVFHHSPLPSLPRVLLSSPIVIVFHPSFFPVPPSSPALIHHALYARVPVVFSFALFFCCVFSVIWGGFAVLLCVRVTPLSDSWPFWHRTFVRVAITMCFFSHPSIDYPICHLLP